MTLFKNRTSFVSAAVFTVLLLGSLFLYFFADNVMVERVLFFPDLKGVEGEMRRLPRQGSAEDDIELLVKEIILGPFGIEKSRILPEGTDLNMLLLRDNSVLYMDFSADMIVSEEKNGLDYRQVADMIKKNVTYNFPFVDQIILTVEGQPLVL